ncbi:MAG: TIGR04376 family protein [Cyanobacteria bacterium J06641_5]
MGLFDDVGRFFETRLEEFLQQNPQLELQALAEQLREQEKDTLRLILDLQAQQKRLEATILGLAQDIKRWHERVENARAANRQDLVRAAQEREAALLFQGNQRWGQMQGLRDRIAQSKTLVDRIQQRQQEVRARIAQLKTQQQAPQATTSSDRGWQQAATGAGFQSFNPYDEAADPLEAEFRNWETDRELDRLKRDMNR